jgi:hypothetical protein
MASGKGRDRGKEQFWRRWIGKWRASNVSGRAFCEAHGLAEASFYGWRRELERRDATDRHFIPVQLAAEPQPSAVEVVLPGNRIIRIVPGFDAATLRQLLSVLEEKPC